MSDLVKATLQRIWSKDDGSVETEGTPVEVQFNPSSLRLALSNTVEGGQSRGRQDRQFIGKSSTELTFDLVFDTADETSGNGQPRSVREKTGLVEQFVVPEVKGKEKQAPPKVRFQWKDLIIDGIISSLTVEMDLFASDGTPLRAKMGVSIKEQDARYAFLKSGAGASTNGAPNAGSPPASGPGSGSSGLTPPTDSSALALAGESAADFARRMGLDPAAWRGLSAGLESTLSLTAGLEIDFSSSLSAGVGLGATAGVELGASVSLEASFGLQAGTGARASASAGFALSAAGGVGAAVQSVQIAQAQAATSATRLAFATSTPSAPSAPGAITPTANAPRAAAALPVTAPPRPAPPEQPRPRLASTGLPSAAQQAVAPPAPPPPRVDPRAISFGYGVPLRPQVAVAAMERSGAVSGHVALGPASRSATVPLRTWDPAAPPWTRLPAGDRARAVADSKADTRKPPGCGCGGTCSCGSKGGTPCR